MMDNMDFVDRFLQIFMIGFPIAIALSYAVYFIFVDWLFSSDKRSKNKWYRAIKKSIFWVGLVCALIDTGAKTLPACLLFFLDYLLFAIISSWGALAFDETKEKSR